MSNKFKNIYDQSLKNPEQFWQEASNDVFWFKKPKKILNKSNPPFYKWYEDGVTNTCYNALDIHIDQGKGKQTCSTSEGKDKRNPLQVNAFVFSLFLLV